MSSNCSLAKGSASNIALFSFDNSSYCHIPSSHGVCHVVPVTHVVGCVVGAFVCAGVWYGWKLSPVQVPTLVGSIPLLVRF